MRKILIGWFSFLLLSFSSLYSINFQIDIITDLNDPSGILVRDNILYSATSGGLLVYDLSTGNFRAWTVGDGYFSQQFATLTRSEQGEIITGSIDGIVSVLNPETGAIQNDESLKGRNIRDVAVSGDTLWVLTEDLVAVYLRDAQSGVYQFMDFFDNFGVSQTNFSAITAFSHRIWLSSQNGLFSAPSDFQNVNLKSASSWVRYSVNEGLPTNQLNDIAAANGNIYIATRSGLSVFDGSNFNTFIAGLVRLELLHLTVQDGQIYASDSFNAYQFDGTRFNPVFRSSFLNIKSLAVDAAGQAWVALKDRGVWRQDRQQKIWIDGPGDNYIGQILKDSKGRIWFASGLVKDERRRGIFVLTDAGWINYRFFGPRWWSSLSSSLGLLEDAAGQVWVSSWGGGVIVFDDKLDFRFLARNTNPGSMWIKSSTRDDTLQVQTTPGLDDKIFGVISNDQFVVVTKMLLDERRKSIWLLNLESRINQPIVQYRSTSLSEQASDPALWNYIAVPFGGSTARELFDVTEDVFGNIWFATQRAGAIVMQIQDSGTLAWGTLTESDNLKSNFLRAIAADQDGYVWIGTTNGLNAFLNNNVFDFRGDFQPIGLKINDIFVDSRNNKWFATDRGLSILKGNLSPFEKSSWIHLVPENSDLFGDNIFHTHLPSASVHSVFLDEDEGDIYLGTDAGIAIIHNNPFTPTFTTFKRLKVGPNPLILDGRNDQAVNFYNLVAGTEVKILTADGKLVRKLNSANFDEVRGAQAQWDGRNQQGDLVASGVYLYLLTTKDGNDSAGKILVIRKNR